MGTGLKASVKLTDWSSAVESTGYAITVGDAAQSTSAVVVDNTTYVAGTDITVTVTLKDAEGNAVSGQASALTDSTVTVPNATQKASSNWVNNGDGTYTGTYVANTVGTGLKASVKLTDWSSAVESTGYAITVGDAAQSTSAVVVDNTTYVAGTDITVTVTLKDAEGNAVSGQASALTDSTVTVPNATQKANSNWVDNGDGTYTGTYVANTVGTGLKASVKLTDWSSAVESTGYAITVGDAVQSTSAVVVDNTTYVAGTDITVTVTLKDAEGNAVSGQASALTDTVTVPNATQKANSNWVDNGDGTYTGTYVANTVGTGLKASVKLTDWSSAVESTGYAITVGDAVQSTSAVVVDNTTYVAGTDITVTVTLKDAEGNAVSGQASALTDSTVTVPNATQKASSNWVNNGDGTYTGTYVANTVGTGLKASVKLTDWTSGVTSGTYAITVGDAAQSTSTVVVDNTTYVAGTDITVTVTLKDAEGNLVSGQASALTDTVTVPNATQKANSNWVDNGDGTYTGTYVANTTGTGLKAEVKLTDWNNAVISAPYAIEPDVNSANIELTWVNSMDLSLSNGTDLNEIEAVIKDANGNVIPEARFNVSLPNGLSLSGVSNPLTVDNDGILKFNVASTSFGKMEIKATVESSGNSSSTTVNFSPVNLTLTVNINN
ncbi:Filamin/ABP280 repeat [Providencia rettgeri]|uniref:Filamin/ABP280 repeat n=1 Tax=Providencia rettgeri TaxID=587 RepID=A0A379LQA7_PRORE|nr:Filamin/ABP280 repeat [Providencia rettgeri]